MHTKTAPCPKCRENALDTRGDNLVLYADGGFHCYACGYHSSGTIHNVWSNVGGKDNGDARNSEEDKESPLPRDFTREVPAAGWKWLLQWGLSYSYWKPHCGYSPASDRLIFPIGNPVKFSIGRYIASGTTGADRNGSKGVGTQGQQMGKDLPKSPDDAVLRLPWVSDKQNLLLPYNPGKWKIYGERSGVIPVLGTENSGVTERVVLVEDWISAHKVSQVATVIPLFGTVLSADLVKTLKALKRPVLLWLDGDQYGYLPKKINRLKAFLEAPVGYLWTEHDPKKYSFEDIQSLLTE